MPSETLPHTPVDGETVIHLRDWTWTRITRAQLLNISTKGGLIRTDAARVLVGPLAIQLETAPELGWITAIPVRFGRSQEVGIQFTHPCPPDFLSKSLLGTNSLSAALEEETPYLADFRLDESEPSEDNQ